MLFGNRFLRPNLFSQIHFKITDGLLKKRRWKNMNSIRQLEKELRESADRLRSNSSLTSNEYCMPVLGLIFLRYAYSRFKLVEAEILKNRPSRAGRVLPVEASDFAAKSALFLCGTIKSMCCSISAILF